MYGWKLSVELREVTHEGDEGLDGGFGEGVVEGGADTTEGTVAAERDESAFFCLCQESFLEGGGG